jgi:hypothetical protein
MAMQISEKCTIRETEMARIASAIEKAAYSIGTGFRSGESVRHNFVPLANSRKASGRSGPAA